MFRETTISYLREVKFILATPCERDKGFVVKSSVFRVLNEPYRTYLGTNEVSVERGTLMPKCMLYRFLDPVLGLALGQQRNSGFGYSAGQDPANLRGRDWTFCGTSYVLQAL